MATAKSDEESDVSSHPLAENRPGVYVQVNSPRRRKKARRADAESGQVAQSSRPPKSRSSAMPPVEALPRGRSLRSDAPTAASGFAVAASPSPQPESAIGPERDDDDSGRESGERSVDFDSGRPARAPDEPTPDTPSAADNSNHRADLLTVSIPPPPRLPNFAPSERDIATDPPLMHSASLLDAPHTLRPDSVPAARPPFTLIAFVALFSAIIVSAGFVALRELGDDGQAAQKADQPNGVGPARGNAAPAPSEPLPRTEQLEPRHVRDGVGVVQEAEQHEDSTRHLPAARVGKGSGLKPAAVTPTATASASASGATARAPIQRKPGPTKGLPAATAIELESDAPVGGAERLPGPDEPLELPVNPYR